MPASKVVDHTEVRRWFDQGVTYPEMVANYQAKYGLDTTITMWSNYARRHKLKRRAVWDTTLVPWSVRSEHQRNYNYTLLTQEARRRAGLNISPGWQKRVDAWKADMERTGTVVHYEPEVSPYFHLVPRREGVDTDLVRVPDELHRREAAD